MTLDPQTFAPESVAPETLAMQAQLVYALTPLWSPPYDAQSLREKLAGFMAAAMGGTIYASPAARERTIANEVKLRLLVPEQPSGTAVLYVHGGGWTVGDRAHGDARFAAWLARGLTVVSVGYRLAPEHPFPAPLDDVTTAMRWFLGEGGKELGARRLAVAGQSAGSNLALAALIRARDAGLPMPAALALGCGAYDLSLTPSALRRGDPPGVLGTTALAWFYDQYVPLEVSRKHPEVSPLYADLRALPPAMLVTGTLDLLLDDSMFLYARYLAAGNRAEIFVGPGADHAWEGMPVPVGQAAEAKLLAAVMGA